MLLLLSLPAMAHVVSMSTGDAKLNGSRLDYELRMPLYEVTHIGDPEPTLFANIRFTGGGDSARLLQHSCKEDQSELVCHGVYLFPKDVETFDVRCTFASVTVPNHVHLLRAQRGDRVDQAGFDGSFTDAQIRFRDLTRSETALRQGLAGFRAAATGLAQILFLLALVVVARSRRELGWVVVAFFGGEALGCFLSPPLAPRFIEAAAALTIAYLAVESLVLPKAGQRWIVAGVAGVFHGAYFAMIARAGDFQATPVLGGAYLAEFVIALVLGALAWVAARASFRLQLQRGLSMLLLVAGIGWFLMRLRN
jgi:hypothetical protein